MASRQAVVFIDYQNAYRGARRAFHDHLVDPHFYGQFQPVGLAKALVAGANDERVLAGVRLYRGLPSATRDPRGNAAAQRQIAAWRRDPLVTVVTHPIRYPDGWPNASLPGERPQEKGIDVALALDFAIMGLEKRYDVGVMFSADTDLKPALDYIRQKSRAWGIPRAEVGAWKSTQTRSARLSLDGEPRLYCHWIDEVAYRRVQDVTDYSQP